MSQNAFLAALQKITEGALPLNELIAAAQQLTNAGQADSARQLYQVWIAMNGEHPLAFIAHFNCSTLQQQLGDMAGAEASLRAALTRNPDFSPAHINLGSALERRGAAKDAVEQWKVGLERMSAVTGDAIEYKLTLLKQISRVMTDNQQHEGAEIALQQAIDIGDGAYVAAGSTITSDVPAGALAVARGHEHISDDWVQRKRPGSSAAAAADDAVGEVHPKVAEARARVRNQTIGQPEAINQQEAQQ